jgi:L,D-transpeptidase YcbB
MDYHKRVLILILLFIVFEQCNNKKNNPASIGNNGLPDEAAELNVREMLDLMLQTKGKMADSTQLYYPAILTQFYRQQGDKQLWIKKQKFLPLADSLHQFITNAMDYGLFPNDYHFSLLKKIRLAMTDSVKMAASKTTLLSQADLLYSDAFMRLAEHLKKGRLAKDSVTLTADTTLADNFYTSMFKQALEKGQVRPLLESLEPKHRGYRELRASLPAFVKQMDTRQYTYVVYPGKDSMQLVRSVMRRLAEAGIINEAPLKPDSSFFASSVSKFQKAKGLKATGKLNAETVRNMNTSDWYRFKRVAANLDRYKTLSAKLPDMYVWVNLPGYYMRVIEKDTTVMESRVVVGRPANRTPVLNSEISNMVLYPTWSVPYSIATKEMLPIARRNPGYFARRGFKVYDWKGRLVNPYSVNWAKYSNRNLPYRFRQNEGGGNALGVIKFNFENPYAVYLHDTNQRYLFSRSSRALSHGCVRVQLWDSLAKFLITRTKPYLPVYETYSRDSISPAGDTLHLSKTVLKDSAFVVADSLKSVMAKRRNSALIMPKRVPIFIRYFGCEAIQGKLVFYDDIYNEDKTLIDKYFAKK